MVYCHEPVEAANDPFLRRLLQHHAAPVVFDDALTHSLARAQVPVRADVLAAHVHLREADSKRSSTDTCR